MDLDKAEKMGNIAVSVVTILAIFCGGIFGLVEYLDYKNNEKIKNSLNLVNRFQSGEILNERLKADSIWQDVYQELITIFKADASPEAYEGFVIAVISKKKMEKSINSMMGIYEETVICVESGLCDQDTIDHYFSKSGRTFFNKYYPYVCNQRKKWNDPTIWENIQKYYNPKSIGKVCS